MRILLLAVLLGVTTPSYSEFVYQYPILCVDTAAIMKTLEKDFEETLTWSGEHDSDKSVYSLWTNTKSGAWTLLKMTPETSCVLGGGAKSIIRLGDPV